MRPYWQSLGKQLTHILVDSLPPDIHCIPDLHCVIFSIISCTLAQFLELLVRLQLVIFNLANRHTRPTLLPWFWTVFSPDSAACNCSK